MSVSNKEKYHLGSVFFNIFQLQIVQIAGTLYSNPAGILHVRFPVSNMQRLGDLSLTLSQHNVMKSPLVSVVVWMLSILPRSMNSQGFISKVVLLEVLEPQEAGPGGKSTGLS